MVDRALLPLLKSPLLGCWPSDHHQHLGFLGIPLAFRDSQVPVGFLEFLMEFQEWEFPGIPAAHLCFRLIKSHIQKGLWHESSINLSIEIEIVFRINLKHSPDCPDHKSS